jgi:hypothetical protein
VSFKQFSFTVPPGKVQKARLEEGRPFESYLLFFIIRQEEKDKNNVSFPKVINQSKMLSSKVSHWLSLRVALSKFRKMRLAQ